MSQIIDLGKLRFTYTGVYSSGTAYEFNDVVSYGGNLYHYKFATSASGVVPTNTSYWNQILKGINFRGVWSSSANYLVGDAVTFGAKTYLCTLDAPTTTPPTNTSFFTLLADGIQYEGEYSELNTYQKGDVVSAGGSAYILTANTSTGNAPTDTAFWAKLVDGAFPNQTGNAGAVLQTDGTNVSWEINPTIAGEVTVEGQLFVGPNAEDFETTTGELTNAAAVFRFDNGENEDGFAQIAFQNADSTSSSDIIAYMDNGDDAYGWIGIGIAGSQFNDEIYGITGPGDGYIFHNAIDDTYAGNIVIATGAEGSENKIIFAAGGFDSGLTQMEITPAVNVHIEIPTPSTSPETGALTVVGGVGIQGDMYIAGAVNIVGDLTFGGGSTTTENLNVTSPIIFAGVGNLTDTVDLGVVGEYVVPVSPIVATITNKSLTSDVATLTTDEPHTYREGDIVVVTDVDSTFNGTYQITVAAGTSFSYAKVAENVSPTAVSPTGTATVSSRRELSGAVRDASDGVFKIFTGATTKPTSTVNFSEAGLAYAPVRIGAATVGGNVEITGTLSSTDDLTVSNTFSIDATTGDTGVGGVLSVTGASNLTGLVTANGGITSSGTLTFSGGANFSGTTDVQELREQVVNVTLASNVGTLDWTAGNIYFIATAPTAAMTFNVTSLPTDNNKVMTINVFVTQGSTGYIPTTFQVGGVNQTIRWVGGTAPTPTSSAGKIDVFTFTLHRTNSSTWIVYASAALNF